MNENKKRVYSISINGRLGLNLHDLNNETSEGNQMITRYVTVVDKEGNLSTVNAISGDMLKHIQASHLYNILKDEDLPLCAGCEIFDANRITIDEDFDAFIKNNDKTEIVNKMLEMCAIDDMEGILVTNNNKNVGRESTVEFGWVVAIPDKFNSDNLFHVKYSNNTYFSMCLDELKSKGVKIETNFREELSKLFDKNAKRKKTEDETDSEEEKNKTSETDVKDKLGTLVKKYNLNTEVKKIIEKYIKEKNSDSKNLEQNIFYRPVNSGLYAVVNNVEVSRIGFNDISKEYVLSPEEIKKRYQALLKSIILTYYSPEGAMRNTQSPHITSFEGVITVSYSKIPAPTISALNDDYKAELKKIVETLKSLNNDIEEIPYSSMAEFVEKMADISKNTLPYGYEE